jgi:hypothetical protein
MTVGQGKKIYAKLNSLSKQIDQLQPLLALLQIPEVEADQDPIQFILQYLQNLLAQGQHQIGQLEMINSKLDPLLATFNIEEL